MRKANFLLATLLSVGLFVTPAQAHEPHYDVNGDNVITYTDAIAVLAHIGGPYDPVFDTTHDGVLNGYDAIEIINYLETYANVPTPEPTALPTAVPTDVPAATPTLIPEPTASPTAVPASATPAPTVIAATVTPVPATATATAAPPANVGLCGESKMQWHAPVINGCDTKHEHGDAPPAWVMTSGKLPMFDHAHITSPLENTVKHNFMKGYLMPDRQRSCLVAYAIQHGSSMGMERIAQLHSTQIWIKDCAGGVSYLSYDNDFGKNGLYPAGHRAGPDNFDAVHNELANEGIIRFATETSGCEQWYGAAFGNKPDASLLLCDAVENFNLAETTNPAGEYDPANWQLRGGLNLFRQFELAWPMERIDVGTYQTDQFGNKVVGACTGTVTYDGVTYQKTCAQWKILQSFKDSVNGKTAEFGVKRAFFLYRNEDILCGPQCSAPN